MADSDWKKRVGIEINFSPESSDDERATSTLECEKEERLGRLSPRFPDSTECSLESAEGIHFSEEDYLHQMMEEYGTTPPRARIRRKERRHREKEEQSFSKKTPKIFYTMRTKRRNTLDSIYLDGLLEKCETNDTSKIEEGIGIYSQKTSFSSVFEVIFIVSTFLHTQLKDTEKERESVNYFNLVV